MKDLSLIIGGKLTEQDQIFLEDVDLFENVDLTQSGALATKLESDGAKVIICTVGTYTKVSKLVNIPVIPIQTTLFDLLTTVQSFEKTTGIKNKKLAFVLHGSRPIDLSKIQPFSNNELQLYTYEDDMDMEELIKHVIADGTDVLIGGPTSVHYAKLAGLSTWLLFFGYETMNVALDKARSLLLTAKVSLERASRLRIILNLFSYGIIITDNNGTITNCNSSGLELLGLAPEDILGKRVYEVIKDEYWIASYINGRESQDMIRTFNKDKFFVSDYPIVLPDNSIVGSVATFQKTEDIEKLEQKYRQIKTAGLTAKNTFSDIIGKSSAMQKAVEKAMAYAQVDSTILIEGETGSGKELFAQSIHNASKRAFEPFIAINCAALPENLLESELMGYEEGAFTGAKKGGKTGLLELANKGTIFLDEINQISPSIQARLLRVIQEKQVLRLGGDRVIPINVKIIAATNESLEKKVEKNDFREDLYYRLNVLNLPIPPVRERKTDIPLLLEYFIKHFSKLHGPIKSLSNESLGILSNYHWPGNVREIYNFVERYAVLSKKSASSESEIVNEYIIGGRIDGKTPEQNDDGYLKIKFDSLENMEKELIAKSVDMFGGNKAQTAMLLGISRTTLWKKVK